MLLTIASTRPALSAPRILFLGYRTPPGIRRIKNGLGRMNLNQDVIILGSGVCQVLELKNIR